MADFLGSFLGAEDRIPMSIKDENQSHKGINSGCSGRLPERASRPRQLYVRGVQGYRGLESTGERTVMVLFLSLLR